MKMNHMSTALLASVVAASAVACGDDQGRQQFPTFEQDLFELAEAEGDLTEFLRLIEVAGLTGGLRGSTVMTIFAPTDSAFQGVDTTALEADQTALSAFLRYHIVGGVQDSNVVTAAGTPIPGTTRPGAIQTITGTVINVRVDGTTVTVLNRNGSATVTAVDIQGSNGLIHKIDAVLTPPPPDMMVGDQNLVQVADAAGLTSLTMAAATAGLADTLMGTGPFTVFAPNNPAFMALGAITPTPEVLANILLTHVVAGSITSPNVLAAGSFNSLANTPIAVDAGAGTIGGARLSTTLDVMASNGVAHVLDDVIVPPTIIETAQATPALGTLVDAVQAAPAAIATALTPDTLNGAMPVTVFAPTNAAFTAAGITDVSMVGTATLAAVLSNHVVATGQALSSGLMDGMMLTTAGGGTLTVNVAMDGSVTVTDAQMNVRNVVTADIRTLGGVVHVIDGVLLP